jgi:hypothetical protein
MSLSEAEVQQALRRLADAKFVSEVSQAGARVTKYEHRMRIKWSLEQDKLAALAMLMLRGPQTAGEIRARAGRMHEFATVAEVEAALQFLVDKYPPLVARLARTPGTKEARYAHLLSGETVEDLQEAAAAPASSAGSRQDRVAQLELEVAGLREEVESLRRQFEEFRKQFD